MATERTKLEHCTGQHSPADGIPLKIPAATCTGSTASPGASSQPRRSLATKGNPRYAILGKWTKLRKQATINKGKALRRNCGSRSQAVPSRVAQRYLQEHAERRLSAHAKNDSYAHTQRTCPACSLVAVELARINPAPATHKMNCNASKNLVHNHGRLRSRAAEGGLR